MKRRILILVLAFGLLLTPMCALAAETVLATVTIGSYVVTLTTDGHGCYTYSVTNTKIGSVVFSRTFCKK